jgi:superfamily II DNA/RNA helicase
VDDHQTIVLDEADEILTRGIKDQINDIIKTHPPNKHVCH